jgi:hypothetical protein
MKCSFRNAKTGIGKPHAAQAQDEAIQNEPIGIE